MVQLISMPWAIPVIFGCLVAIVAIIANSISTTLRTNAEIGLKRQMVERGYTAAEIERVMRASSGESEPCSSEISADTVPRKPPKQHAL